MPIQDIGNLQDGLNADCSGLTLNGQVTVPPGGILPIGYPVARNLLALQSGYLSQFASVPGLGGFANGDQQVSIAQSGVQGATTGSGNAGGVWVGPPTANPWLTYPAQTLNTSPFNASGLIARMGLVKCFVGAANGGTSVKVGDYVGKGPTLGTTSAYPFLTSSGGTSRVAGNTYGQVVATPIWTTLASAVAAGSANSVYVFNTNGMTTAVTPLTINPGGANAETVVPSAVSATAPAIAALTISGTAGSASIVQITFNLAGYAGSASGSGPSGTGTTTFSLIVPIPNGSTATAAAGLILAALLNSGFTYGMPPNILGVGAGQFVQSGAAAGASTTGPLLFATQSAGVLTFSAAMPGAWANSLLTYTVTVIGGTTQTYNTNVGGSATAVAFASGASGFFTATFQNSHVIGEPVIGFNTTSQGVIIPVPGTAGMLNTGLALVDIG